MKKFIYGFSVGFSFFVTRWLFDIATTDIASKPYSVIAYLLLPMLIGIFYFTEREGKKDENAKR